MANISMYKDVYITSAFNLGFFGGGRCGNNQIDGHFKFYFSTKENKFSIIKLGGYGGFMVMSDEKDLQPLSEIEQRLANDYLLDTLGKVSVNRFGMTNLAEELWLDIYEDERNFIDTNWHKMIKYDLVFSNSSLRIGFGDTIKDKTTGEVFELDHNYDNYFIKVANRDEKYEITKRCNRDYLKSKLI